MPKYEVKLEFYGKHMKTVVEADNDFRADMEVRRRLHIFSIKEVPPVVGDDQFIKDFFKGFRS